MRARPPTADPCQRALAVRGCAALALAPSRVPVALGRARTSPRNTAGSTRALARGGGIGLFIDVYA
ncbi:MAG: hypothetical protein KGM44_09770 [bacterium]|nr:hypothetical protein [bacterium]